MLNVMISMLFFAVQNAANKEFGARYPMRLKTLFRFEWIIHVAMIACMAAIGAWPSLFEGGVFPALYGFTFLSTVILLTTALSAGPVGKTTLIVNLSLLLSVTFGIVAMGEKMTLWRWVGIPCVIATLVLSAGESADGKGKSAKWLLLSILAFFGDGMLSVIQKVFISKNPGADTLNFLMDASVVGLILSTAACIFMETAELKKRLHESKNNVSMRKNQNPGKILIFCVLAIVVGLSTVGGTEFNMRALQTLDGVVVFPVRQGSLILVMTVYGILRYRDSFDARTGIMLASGLAGIVFLNL